MNEVCVSICKWLLSIKSRLVLFEEIEANLVVHVFTLDIICECFRSTWNDICMSGFFK